MCAELADLAMQLARAAAARTLAGWAEPSTAAEPYAKPAAEPPADPLPAATPRRAAGNAASTASPPRTDPAVLFTRFAAVVRDCIALAARLAAAPAAAPTRTRALLLRADPRRALLHNAFRVQTANHPDRADLLRETTTRLDEELAADADQTTHPADLFANLCDELGIEIDLALLPDELLGSDPETTYPDEDPYDAPDPRATSPP